MARKIIATEGAPAAVGPYSQAVASDGFVYAAGQLGLHPQTGRLVAGGVQAQARQALSNLQAVLEAAGTSMGQVVKTILFVQDMGDFQAVNQVYTEFFPSDPPARSTVQVAALPLGGLVEIEAIAALE